MILGYEITPSKETPVQEDFLFVVGVLSGMGVHTGHNRRKQPKNPPTIAQVALWNEFGTKHMDPRPSFRSVTGTPEGRKQIDEVLAESIRQMNDGAPRDQVMGVVGTAVASMIQLSMDKWGVVDTGLTKRSISWDEVPS